MLNRTGTRALLVSTGEHPRWQLASTHVDGGELLSQAVRRELRDECGLLRFDVLEPHLAVQQDIVACQGVDRRHVDHVFAVLADPVDSGPAEDTGERGDLGWFDLDRLPEPLAPGVRMHLHQAVRVSDKAR